MVIVCLREASPKAWSGYEEGRMGVGEDRGDVIQARDEEVLDPGGQGGDWGQGDSSWGLDKLDSLGCLGSRTEVDSST